MTEKTRPEAPTPRNIDHPFDVSRFTKRLLWTISHGTEEELRMFAYADVMELLTEYRVLDNTLREIRGIMDGPTVTGKWVDTVRSELREGDVFQPTHAHRDARSARPQDNWRATGTMAAENLLTGDVRVFAPGAPVSVYRKA